ncbi:MAG: hypothetical protein ACFFDK_19030 [Promethearchaeota archaeon]
MKIKNLIERLNKLDENADIIFSTSFDLPKDSTYSKLEIVGESSSLAIGILGNITPEEAI